MARPRLILIPAAPGPGRATLLPISLNSLARPEALAAVPGYRRRETVARHGGPGNRFGDISANVIIIGERWRRSPGRGALRADPELAEEDLVEAAGQDARDALAVGGAAHPRDRAPVDAGDQRGVVRRQRQRVPAAHAQRGRAARASTTGAPLVRFRSSRQAPVVETANS